MVAKATLITFQPGRGPSEAAGRPGTRHEDEILLQMNGVADGIRTHDNRNHNPGLYR